LLAPERELKNDYNVNIVSLVLSASHYDGFLAGAQNAASLDFGGGKVNMTGSTEDHQADDLSGQNTQGRFKRLKWNLSRNQFLTDTWALNFDATGQFANRNLDSSEKLYLGGINGIRAYPTSEGSGSDGYIMKLELRKFLPYNFNASVFMDHGRIQQYHDDKNLEGEPLIQEPIGAGEKAIPNRYILNGYGATLAWNGPYNSTIKATYATRIKDNPNPATDKINDQDGSLRRHVLWLSGSIAF
jgi:hemolysin activation/secretion protein